MKQHTKRRLVGLAFLLVLGLSCAVVGCGPQLDRVSSLNTLRIVGVRKSAPYAQPGETVHLQMLWEDGREELPEQVETFFGFWCLNPPGNSYSQCLAVLPTTEPVFEFNQSEFELTIPEDSLRANPNLPDAPESGSAFVFYGVCAGKFRVPQLDGSVSDPEDLVPACVDEDGKEVGPEDFVIGYSQIYVYEELRNENPQVLALKQGDDEIKLDCIDADCDAPFPVPDLEGCEEGVICLEACEDDGDPILCKGKSIEVVVDESSAEADELASFFGSELEESLWVSYFVDRGGIAPELKLINESGKGWIDDHSTEIFPPKEPGPIRVWAAVRDNRGGISWLRAPGYVKEKD